MYPSPKMHDFLGLGDIYGPPYSISYLSPSPGASSILGLGDLCPPAPISELESTTFRGWGTDIIYYMADHIYPLASERC